MGTDAFARSGVLVHFEEFVDMLVAVASDDGVVAVRDRLLADADCCERLKVYSVYVPVRESEASDKRALLDAGDACALLRKVNSCMAFRQWLILLCREAVRGDVGRYGECWVEEEDLIRQIVDVVVSRCGISLPSFELEAFGNSRLTGLWDIEHGELYFNFSADECFERVLTPTGQALAARLGETLGVSEWVSISY